MHIGGIISPNINIIKKICQKYNVPLVEDAAQAQGSTYKNIHAGNFGIAGAISFYNKGNDYWRRWNDNNK